MTKKDYKKKVKKDIKIFLKKKKTKRNKDMFVNYIKFYQKMENKVCLNIATNFIKWRKNALL